MRHDSPRHDLLLAAVDLDERRLLYAELQEVGYEVLPVPGLFPALQTVFLRLITPRLILVDTQGDQYATPKHMEEMLQLAPGVPVVLVIGVFESETWKPFEPRLQSLRRPIRIGEVVDVVRRAVSPSGI